jgi:bacillopeptidase F
VDAFDVQSRVEETDHSTANTVTDPAARWILEDTGKAWSGTSANTGTGTAALSSTAGARAEFTFTGTDVTWIGFKGPIAGIATVSLDGSFVATLDLYAPTEGVRVPVLALTGLTPGTHTLRIDVTGQKNASATGSYVIVDAFDVPVPTPAPPVTRFQQNDVSVVYTPATDWTTSGQSSLFSGRTVATSAAAGAQAEFTFTGTSVRFIGQRLRDAGIVRVLLDGVFVADIDTHSPLQDEYQAVVFSRTGLAPGTHRLTIMVTGTKNPASGATTIHVDAFDVY